MDEKLKILTTEYGQLPCEIFDIQRSSDIAKVSADLAKHEHLLDVQSDGQIWDVDRVFDFNRLLSVMNSKGLERFKGIFNTNEGWQLLEWASGEVHHRSIGSCEQSQAEWILDKSVHAYQFKQQFHQAHD